jgi:hypothetical protein
MLKNPLGAGRGLLPTLRWVGSWFFREVDREKISQLGIETPTILFGFGYLSIVIQ